MAPRPLPEAAELGDGAKRPAVPRPALPCASQPPSWASKGGAACVGVGVGVSVCVCVVAEYPASYFIRAPVCVALGPRPQAHLHSFLSLLPPKLAPSLNLFYFCPTIPRPTSSFSCFHRLVRRHDYQEEEERRRGARGPPQRRERRRRRVSRRFLDVMPLPTTSQPGGFGFIAIACVRILELMF